MRGYGGMWFKIFIVICWLELGIIVKGDFICRCLYLFLYWVVFFFDVVIYVVMVFVYM